MKSSVIFRNFMLLDMEHLERTILMDLEQLLREKINKRTLRIAIIGLGYVGLPLAVTFAEAGFTSLVLM